MEVHELPSKKSNRKWLSSVAGLYVAKIRILFIHCADFDLSPVLPFAFVDLVTKLTGEMMSASGTFPSHVAGWCDDDDECIWRVGLVRGHQVHQFQYPWRVLVWDQLGPHSGILSRKQFLKEK